MAKTKNMSGEYKGVHVAENNKLLSGYKAYYQNRRPFLAFLSFEHIVKNLTSVYLNHESKVPKAVSKALENEARVIIRNASKNFRYNQHKHALSVVSVSEEWLDSVWRDSATKEQIVASFGKPHVALFITNQPDYHLVQAFLEYKDKRAKVMVESVAKDRKAMLESGQMTPRLMLKRDNGDND